MKITTRITLICIFSLFAAVISSGYFGFQYVKPQTLMTVSKIFDAMEEEEWGFRSVSMVENISTAHNTHTRIVVGCELNNVCTFTNESGLEEKIPPSNEMYKGSGNRKAVILHGLDGEVIHDSFTDLELRRAWKEIHRAVDYDSLLKNVSPLERSPTRNYVFIKDLGAFVVTSTRPSETEYLTTYVSIGYTDRIASIAQQGAILDVYSMKSSSFTNLANGAQDFDVHKVINTEQQFYEMGDDVGRIRLVDGVYYRVPQKKSFRKWNNLITLPSIPAIEVYKIAFGFIAPFVTYAITFTVAFMLIIYLTVYFLIVRPTHSLAYFVDSYFANRRDPDVLSHFPTSGKGEIKTLLEQLKTLFFELQSHERNIERYAYFDEMTGVLNRRSIDIYLDKLIDSDESNVALFMTDIDNFKTINDTFGHDCGDDAIRSISDILDRNITNDPLPELGEHDDKLMPNKVYGRVGRLGGDEFVVIVRSSNEKHLRRYIDAVMEEIRATEFDFNGTKHKITLSVGIAIGDHGHHARQLKQEADIAMYIAKRGGKNSYDFYHEDHLADFHNETV